MLHRAVSGQRRRCLLSIDTISPIIGDSMKLAGLVALWMIGLLKDDVNWRCPGTMLCRPDGHLEDEP